VISLLATPDSRSAFFSQWLGGCTGTVNPCVLTMDADKAVVAQFDFVIPLTSRDAPLSWSTQLEVPDGEGQVVMNGRVAYAVRQGLAAQAAEARSGANRVEAVLARGAGRSGTWRFDFSAVAAFKPGSLRVVAGTVAVITPDAVVFRLQGKPGERVVFTFEVDD
jgi:hypothetical protein